MLLNTSKNTQIFFFVRNPLHLNKGIIFCQCGIRIDTEVSLYIDAALILISVQSDE